MITMILRGGLLAGLLGSAVALGQERVIQRGAVRDAEREVRTTRPGSTVVRGADRSGRRVERDDDRRARPPYGALYHDVPRDHRLIRRGDRTYYEYDGVYYLGSLEAGRQVYRVTRPPAGVVCRELPRSSTTIIINNTTYYCDSDVYYTGRPTLWGTEYVVVDPPLGAVVEFLPDGCESIRIDEVTCFRHGDAFYRPYLRGGRLVYVVVSPPRGYRPAGYPSDGWSDRPGWSEASGRVAGVLSCRTRMALPPGAEVEVRLVGRGPSDIISERRFEARGNVPLEFDLEFDPRRVDRRSEYGVEARILVDGRPRWIHERPCRVRLDERNDRLEIRLIAAR